MENNEQYFCLYQAIRRDITINTPKTSYLK